MSNYKINGYEDDLLYMIDCLLKIVTKKSFKKEEREKLEQILDSIKIVKDF